MKTTTGSLVKRGRNFYCFWRSKGKAFCKVLRDESGQPITHKTDAERAKAKLMEFFGRRNQVESLRVGIFSPQPHLLEKLILDKWGN